MKKLLSFAVVAVVFAMVAAPAMASWPYNGCGGNDCNREPVSVSTSSWNTTRVVSVPVSVSNTGLNMQDNKLTVRNDAYFPTTDVTSKQTMTTGKSGATSVSYVELLRPANLCGCPLDVDDCDCDELPNQTFKQSNRVSVLSVPIALSNTGLNLQNGYVYAGKGQPCMSLTTLNDAQNMTTGDSTAYAQSWVVVNGRIEFED